MKRGIVAWLIGLFLVGSLLVLAGFNLSETRILVAQAYVAQRLAVPASAPAGQESSQPKVVFSSIDRDPAVYGYTTARNVTGIVEHLPLAPLRDTVTALRPGQPARIAVIGMPDETGIGEMLQVQAFDWAPHRLMTQASPSDFAAWKAAVEQLQGQADVLIVLSFNGLPASAQSRRMATMTEVATWTEQHAKPLPIGIGTSYVENGGGVAIAPSPQEMGEVAMRQALDCTRRGPNGETHRPAIAHNVRYRVAANETALTRRGVVLHSIYLEAARLDQPQRRPAP